VGLENLLLIFFSFPVENLKLEHRIQQGVCAGLHAMLCAVAGPVDLVAGYLSVVEPATICLPFPRVAPQCGGSGGSFFSVGVTPPVLL
jgi:hypothetical protein